MEFDTPFDRWLRANDIRPLRLSQKAKVSRPTVLRFRKGSLGRAATRAKVVAACSTFVGRRVMESELFFGLEADDRRGGGSSALASLKHSMDRDLEH